VFEINYNTKLFGIIGKNINYTLSPAIHNYSFQKLEINAVYLAFDFDESKFERVIPSLLDLGEGFNVTIPYKEKIIKYLDELDTTAEKIGAVNTIKEKKGYNTDYLALKSILNEIGYYDSIIFGSGGAAKAISFAIAEEGLKVYIYDRRKEKREKLAEYINSMGYKVSAIENCSIEYGIIANATPNPSFIPDECIKGDIAIDFVYTPVITTFLDKAKRKGMKEVNGLKILIRQALEAQKIWFGKTIDENEVVNLLYARKLVR
jgi:shikimate dehydrogenase